MMAARIFIITLLCSVTTTNHAQEYKKYFDEATFQLLKKAYTENEKGNFRLTDSICTLIINNPANKISKEMPVELNPYYLRAQNNYFLKNYKKAIQDFNHVSRGTPNDIGIFATLTDCYLMLKEFDSAIENCNKAIAFTSAPDKNQFIAVRGSIYYYKGDMKKACDDFKVSNAGNLHPTYQNMMTKACK